jgi:hypothetical protein
MSGASGVVVEVSARKFAVPFECVCCGAAPETDVRITHTRTAKQRALETTRGLSFPYCARCEQHVVAWEAAGVPSAGVTVLGILVGIVLGIVVRWYLGLVVALAAAAAALVLATKRRERAAGLCGPACATPAKGVVYMGWSGTVNAFSFASPTYTARFADQNDKKLVNVSSALRRLLDGYHKARLAVPTPATAVSVVTKPPTVLEWIARIESFKGSVARRNALERALEVIHEPKDRHELVLAASRIEIAAVLDHVDRLSSHIAKKRRLQKAIEDIRADNIPDELQDAELRELETRLRDLG